MKLIFDKIITSKPTIKITFDGEHYNEYNVDTLLAEGITFSEEDCPDLTNLKIKGSFKSFNDISISKKIGDEKPFGISCTYEKDIYESNTSNYYCFVFDTDFDNQITENDINNSEYIWLKHEISENAEIFSTNDFGIPQSVDKLSPLTDIFIDFKGFTITDDTIQFINGSGSFIRYPEGDLSEDISIKIGAETYNDTVTEIEETPTIRENGQIIADIGKAFKYLNVKVGTEKYLVFEDINNSQLFRKNNKPITYYIKETDFLNAKISKDDSLYTSDSLLDKVAVADVDNPSKTNELIYYPNLNQLHHPSYAESEVGDYINGTEFILQFHKTSEDTLDLITCHLRPKYSNVPVELKQTGIIYLEKPCDFSSLYMHYFSDSYGQTAIFITSDTVLNNYSTGMLFHYTGLMPYVNACMTLSKYNTNYGIKPIDTPDDDRSSSSFTYRNTKRKITSFNLSSC